MSYKPDTCDLCKLDSQKREAWKESGGHMPSRLCPGHLDQCRDCKKLDIRINTDMRCNRCWVAWAKAKLSRDKQVTNENQVIAVGLIENAESKSAN